MNRLEHHYDSAPANADRAGDMQGFDSEFTDIIDYILRITYRIWEGKQIGLCHDYYSDDCRVYTLAGYGEGVDQVVQNTLNTLAAFPDRTLDADNIVWGGNDVDGYHTSHLIDTRMTNLGDTELGPATGNKAQFKVIAHCVVKDNKIIEEWLVRDNYALVEQLGYKPKKVAKQIARLPLEPKFDAWRQSEITRVSELDLSHRAETNSSNSSEEFVLAALQNIWNARLMGDVYKVYDEDAKLHASANRELLGREQIVQFYGSFLGTFSELKVAFDYSCTNSMTDADDVAVRWTMTGKHTGRGLFGEPTDADILIIGESQYRLVDGKITEEWTVFDQIAIMTQIARARLENKTV